MNEGDQATVTQSRKLNPEKVRECVIKKRDKNKIKKDRNEREKKPSYRAERKLDESPPWEEVKIGRKSGGGGRITRMDRRVDHRPG